MLAGVRMRRLAGPEADLSPMAATELTLVVNGLGLLTPASPAEGIAFEYPSSAGAGFLAGGWR